MALWAVLKGRQLEGYKFTRQFPVGPYFAGFACRHRFLLIELDGSQHIDSIHDEGRDAWLRSEGYSILRFPGNSVLNNRVAVCDTILAVLEGRVDGPVEAHDVRYLERTATPRRFLRHRPWAANVST